MVLYLEAYLGLGFTNTRPQLMGKSASVYPTLCTNSTEMDNPPVVD